MPSTKRKEKSPTETCCPRSAKCLKITDQHQTMPGASNDTVHEVIGTPNNSLVQGDSQEASFSGYNVRQQASFSGLDVRQQASLSSYVRQEDQVKLLHSFSSNDGNVHMLAQAGRSFVSYPYNPAATTVEDSIPPAHCIDGATKRKTDKSKRRTKHTDTEKELNILMQYENLNFVPNTEGFLCPVCHLPVAAEEGVILRDCLHSFCKECLANAVICTFESFVQCPYKDNSYSCRSTLQHREIKALVSDNVYEQFLQRSLSLAETVAEKSFHCLKAGCPGWCFYEDNVNIFHCPVCSHYNCFTCQTIHEGPICMKYQGDLNLNAATDQLAQNNYDLSEPSTSGRPEIIRISSGRPDETVTAHDWQVTDDEVLFLEEIPPSRSKGGLIHNSTEEADGSSVSQLCSSAINVEDCIFRASEREIYVENAKDDDNESSKRNCGPELDYLSLLKFQDMSLIPNTEDIDCPVCFMPVAVGQGVLLQDCLHGFCKECLAYAIEYSTDSDVKCPNNDESGSCPSILQHREIKALVSAEIYEKFLQRSLSVAESRAENSFHCLTPDCSGWCLYEDDINIFFCHVCSHHNCLTCRAIHDGFNCQQYQDNLKRTSEKDVNNQKTLLYLEEMIGKGEAMRCPRCYVIIMKKSGCAWIMCSVCKTEVCWVTKGPRWGPLGKGDTSGGCRCKVNGVRCHRNCNDCH